MNSLNDEAPYFKVYLGQEMTVSGILTQGFETDDGQQFCIEEFNATVLRQEPISQLITISGEEVMWTDVTLKLTLLPKFPLPFHLTSFEVLDCIV